MIFFPIGYASLSFCQDFLVNAYFWILIGILFRLPHLALSAQFSAMADVPVAKARVPNRMKPQSVL
jgi:hypothetical protein